MTIELLNIDCMEYMATCEDNAFDLAIVDCPYGIGETAKRSKQRVPKTQSKKWRNRKAPDYKGNDSWDNSSPDKKYFLELMRVSKNQIIWGANHFAGDFESSSSGWVVWFKKRFDEKNDFSDAELAYTSFKRGCRLFHMPWIGFGAVNAGEKRIHPTQKPVKLYDWLLTNYAKPGQRILDTHLGSASSAIAAHYFGVDFVGCELDKDYYDAACQRFDDQTRQKAMF